MTSLAVTVKGQITLKRDLLQHLGIKPSERVELEKLPGRELRVLGVLEDDEAQCRAARDVLASAALISVTLPSLCEFVWILRRGAGLSKEDAGCGVL